MAEATQAVTVSVVSDSGGSMSFVNSQTSPSSKPTVSDDSNDVGASQRHSDTADDRGCNLVEGRIPETAVITTTTNNLSQCTQKYDATAECTASLNADKFQEEKATSQNIVNPRIVIFFGRKASGKKTVAKSMFPDISEEQTVQAGADTEFTEMKSSSGDIAILINLEPSLVERRRRQTILKYKGYFDSLRNRLSDSQCFVYLIVFVYRRGCFTDEDRDICEYLLSCLTTNSYSVKSRMALVITCCEDLSTETQMKVVENFHTNRGTKHFAEFLNPNIICVGFPNVGELVDSLRDSYTKVIEESKRKLNTLLDNAGSVIDDQLEIDKLFGVPNTLLDLSKYLVSSLKSYW